MNLNRVINKIYVAAFSSNDSASIMIYSKAKALSSFNTFDIPFRFVQLEKSTQLWD
jgi:hypothetical protein